MPPDDSPPARADDPTDISPSGWKQILLDTWKDAGKDNLSLIAAGVGFYAFLAFVPLLSAFVMSYGLFAEPASVVRHVQTLTSVMPQNAAGIIGDQLQSLTETSGTQTGFALLLALGIALYGASKGAAAVITALNIMYEVEESRGFVKRTLVSLALTAGTVLVLILAILAVSAMNFLESLLPELGGAVGLLLKAAFFLLAASAVVILLAAIYRYAPDRPDAHWRWITPGSALATIVWVGATFGFGIYVSNFSDYNATYGSLGAVIVFLTWLYLSAYIVLFGAEMNSILEMEVQDEPARAGATPAQDRSPLSDEPAPGRPTRPQQEDQRQEDQQEERPSFVALLTRLGMLSALLGLIGNPRRAGGVR